MCTFMTVAFPHAHGAANTTGLWTIMSLSLAGRLCNTTAESGQNIFFTLLSGAPENAGP